MCRRFQGRRRFEGFAHAQKTRITFPRELLPLGSDSSSANFAGRQRQPFFLGAPCQSCLLLRRAASPEPAWRRRRRGPHACASRLAPHPRRLLRGSAWAAPPNKGSLLGGEVGEGEPSGAAAAGRPEAPGIPPGLLLRLTAPQEEEEEEEETAEAEGREMEDGRRRRWGKPSAPRLLLLWRRLIHSPSRLAL